MKILSNKKYNELILKSCKGMFGAVTDDMLLRDNALLDEENKQLKDNWNELKKQLEEYQLQNINLIADIMIQKMAFPNKLIKDKTFYDLYNMPTYEELLDQQKEFIKYLEDESKEIYRDGGLRQNIFRQIFQKYKSIIAVLDEKEN